MFRTSNPVFARNESFQPAQSWDDLKQQGRYDEVAPASASGAGHAAAVGAKTMSIQGTVNKTFFLLAICVATSLVAWNIAMSAEPIINPTLMVFGGAILGLITGLVVAFAPKTAPITAPLYAAFEGFFVGGVSAFYAMRFATPIKVSASGSAVDAGATALNTGLIMNAVLLTFGICAGMLVGYTTRLIRPGPIFRNIVITGTLGVCFYALIAMGASLFGFGGLASVYDPSNGGLISVGFSLLLVGLASANLVLDFEFIENAVAHRAPRYMEWVGAFGLMVTLVWLYIEVLRLFAKLRGNSE